jgi:hypothetical protein
MLITALAWTGDGRSAACDVDTTTVRLYAETLPIIFSESKVVLVVSKKVVAVPVITELTLHEIAAVPPGRDCTACPKPGG